MEPDDEERRAREEVVVPMEFATVSYTNDYIDVPELGLTKSNTLKDYCPKTCPDGESGSVSGNGDDNRANTESVSAATAAAAATAKSYPKSKMEKLKQLIELANLL